MTPSPVACSRAATALRQNSIPCLRRLCVEESEAVVVIAGQVSSYYLKQLAQEAIMPALAGRELINRVTVVRSPNGE
jgi:hypothetical protein